MLNLIHSATIGFPYIRIEDGPWDTSKALVRRTLERCIHLGRQHRAQGRKEDLYEAYRLLGQLVRSPKEMRLQYVVWHECITNACIFFRDFRCIR